MSWVLPLLLIPSASQTGYGAELPLDFLSPAVADAGQRPPVRARFDNGLRAVCVQNPATQTVALSAFITTSARAEVASNAGIRSLVARAVVDCSASDQPAIVDEMHDLGAQAFVGAALDFTEITLLAAAEDVGRAAALLHTMLFRVHFDPDGVDRLRREVAANLAKADELGTVAAENAAAARLYPNHPFGWPPEGLAAAVSGTTVEDVRRVYEGSYLPNNMVIVVAGGAPPQQALDAVGAVFRSALPGARLPETQKGLLPPRTGREELARPGGAAVVYIGARAPGLSDPAYAPAMVALSLMGAGLHSRLYHSLRRERGIAYTIDAGAVTARQGARAGLIVSCPSGAAPEAESRMVREMRRLATEPAPAEEIRRATEYICTSYALNHQRSADLAHQLGALEVTADQGHAFDGVLPSLIRATTPETVMEAARSLFGRTVTVCVLPS